MLFIESIVKTEGQKLNSKLIVGGAVEKNCKK